jgi:hypothetical protein
VQAFQKRRHVKSAQAFQERRHHPRAHSKSASSLKSRKSAGISERSISLSVQERHQERRHFRGKHRKRTLKSASSSRAQAFKPRAQVQERRAFQEMQDFKS